MCKELIELNNIERDNPPPQKKNWAEDLNRHFSQEEKANRYMKRGSISLDIGEMKTKTIMRYHLAPIRMAIINKKITNVGEVVEKKDPSHTADGNIK